MGGCWLEKSISWNEDTDSISHRQRSVPLPRSRYDQLCCHRQKITSHRRLLWSRVVVPVGGSSPPAEDDRLCTQSMPPANMAPSSAATSNTPGSSSSDRYYQASNGRRPSVVASRHDRTPNTPRKNSSGRDKAVQDPGLRDYVCQSLLRMDCPQRS